MVLDSKAYDQVSLGLLHLELRGSSIGHNGAFSPQWLIFCEPVEPTHAAGARKPIRAQSRETSSKTALAACQRSHEVPPPYPPRSYPKTSGPANCGRKRCSRTSAHREPSHSGRCEKSVSCQFET